MLNGRLGSDDHVGSGTILWKARDLHAAGEINEDEFVDMVSAGQVFVHPFNGFVLTFSVTELLRLVIAIPWALLQP
jgi:hypothetical protein